jgi:ribosomal protein S18 acetylase RimI-like enzyme
MDERIQQSVVGSLAAREHTMDVGPFVVGWNPTNDNKYFTYATPRPGRKITDEDVAQLVAAFRDIERTPRLEYVLSSAPSLEERLLAAGFEVEERHDYLVCTPATFHPAPAPDGFILSVPESDEDFRELISAQNEAFGDHFDATDADIERGRRTQDKGGTIIMARAADGRVAGGGQASIPSLGLVEVGGIATREDFRRRGVGAAVTSAITERAFAAGVEAAWLEASGEQSWRVYERAGYVPTGKRLYISIP